MLTAGIRLYKVLVGLSLTAEGNPRHIRLEVLPRIDLAHLEPPVVAMVAHGARIKTDGLRSYLSLGSKGFLHDRVITKDANILEELRWLHVAVSNAKALIGGTYHGLGRLGANICRPTWTNTLTASTDGADPI